MKTSNAQLFHLTSLVIFFNIHHIYRQQIMCVFVFLFCVQSKHKKAVTEQKLMYK